MNEFNPAAEAEKIAAQAAADLAKAGTTIEGDVNTIEGDVKTDVEKAVAEVKPAEITIHTDANTVNASIAADVAAAKAGATADAKTDLENAHSATVAAVCHLSLSSLGNTLSSELVEAKQKLEAALGWFEAHFTNALKAAAPAPAATTGAAPLATPPARS